MCACVYVCVRACVCALVLARVRARVSVCVRVLHSKSSGVKAFDDALNKVHRVNL